MQLESPLATPQLNLWQNYGINRVICQTFCRKAFLVTDDATAIFTKNVTYLLHSMEFSIRVKWWKRAEIWQTIGFGSDDF